MFSMLPPLGDETVVVVDCQSTGASPERGRVLELGWTTIGASGVQLDAPPRVTAQLVQLPPDEDIPRAVTRVTGIRQADLAAAVPPAQAWAELADAAAQAAPSGEGPARTIIHYARFEEPFLRQLHRAHGTGVFPLDIACTHQMARRVLASLPRRGLRAVAGYFGFPVGQLRRCAGHVAASAFVWAQLVPLLAAEGVATWDELGRWLAASRPAAGRARVYPMARDKRLAVPTGPGVYRFLRRGGDVLYIGKATSLRRRVNSYFQKQRGVGERQLEMLSQARDLAVTETTTALEAALLEADEIKRHAPPYNIALRQADRSVWFARPEGTAARRQVDAGHPIGPLPRQDCLQPVAALAEVLSQPGTTLRAEPIRAALGMPSGFTGGLTPECFAAGVAAFVAEHLTEPGVVTIPSLLALGAELWRRRLLTAGDGEPSEPGDEPASPDAEPAAWDPPRVMRALEHGVLAAGQAVRRARWLRWLSESTVAWHEPDQRSARLRLLVIERGAIAQRDYVDSVAELPVPAARRRSLRERQDCFDLATYDRLRTLGTELRRILTRPGTVGAVRLGAGPAVQGWALQRVLQWA